MKDKYNIIMSKDTVGNYSRGHYKNNRKGKILSLKRKLYKNRFKFEYIEEKGKAND